MTVKQWQSADLFCGSGGAAESFRKAIARLNGKDPAKMKAADWELFLQDIIGGYIAVNHWGTAITTHTANYPWATHYHADISNIKPREAIPGGYLDLLLAGPECTFHSNAAGDRPINDQSRITAWQVLDWLDRLYVKTLIIENVPEFMKWGPLNKDGHRNKKLMGATFLAYIDAIKALGYKVEYKVLKAADYGDPTSRQRLFILGRRDGKPVTWPEPSHRDPKLITRGSSQTSFIQASEVPWRTARSIINWDHKGKSIFEKNLSPNTLRRIMAGLMKYGLRPLMLPNEGYYRGNAARTVDEPIPGMTGSRGAGHLVEPFIAELHQNQTAHGIDHPLGAIMAGGTHYAVVDPFLIGAGGPAGTRDPRSIDQPLGTVTGSATEAVCVPFIVSAGGNEQTPLNIDDPMRTVMTREQYALAEPFLVALAGAQYAGKPRSVDSPLNTILVDNRVGVAQPQLTAFVLNLNGGKDKYNRANSIEDPVHTITTTNRPAVVEPFIIATDMSHSRGDQVHSIDTPAPTIMVKNRLAVLDPYLIPVSHGPENRGRGIDEPLDTVTRFHNQGLLEPYMIEYHGTAPDGRERTAWMDEPIPTLDTSNRYVLCQPFLVKYYRTTMAGQGVDVPLDTVTTKGRFALCVPVLNGYVLVDVLFRMLEPEELAAAHSFPKSFIFMSVNKKGRTVKATKRDQVKMVGNSWPTELGAALCLAQMVQ